MAGAPVMDESLAELAGYFHRKARLPDQELIGLTAAARAGGSRWDVMAAACRIQTYQDLARVIYRVTGETGAELLFSATQYAIGQVTGSRDYYSPVIWACPQCPCQVTDRGPRSARYSGTGCARASPMIAHAAAGMAISTTTSRLSTGTGVRRSVTTAMPTCIRASRLRSGSTRPASRTMAGRWL